MWTLSVFFKVSILFVYLFGSVWCVVAYQKLLSIAFSAVNDIESSAACIESIFVCLSTSFLFILLSQSDIWDAYISQSN